MPGTHEGCPAPSVVGSGGLALARALAAGLAQEGQALLEELLELGDRATLEQHVPVGADVLDGLGLGLRAPTLQLGLGAAAALPGVRDVGLDGEGELDGVPVRAQVRRDVALAGDDVRRRSPCSGRRDRLPRRLRSAMGISRSLWCPGRQVAPTGSSASNDRSDGVVPYRLAGSCQAVSVVRALTDWSAGVRRRGAPRCRRRGCPGARRPGAGARTRARRR